MFKTVILTDKSKKVNVIVPGYEKEQKRLCIPVSELMYHVLQSRIIFDHLLQGYNPELVTLRN